MPTVSGAMSELYAPGLRKIFFQSYKERPAQYSQIANMGKSSRQFEEDIEYAGFGTMPPKPEGSATVYTDPTQGGKKRYTHISYGLGFRVTVEAMEDDLYGVIKKMPRELGKSGRNARELQFFGMMERMFTTEFGFTKNGSNEALISTSHSLIQSGGTLANRSATDADLGPASLEAAILLFDNLVDEAGIPIIRKPRWLVVGPALKQIATELLGGEFKPYTSDNTVNAITRNDTLSVIVTNYLTDPDSWYLLADEHDLNFIERTPMRFQNGDDFDSGDAKYKCFQRFSVGAGDWRGIFGSLGA